VDFLGVAENFFFFGCAHGSLEAAADTWKNAANVVAARLLKHVHAGDDTEGLDKTIRESEKDILTTRLVASRLVDRKFRPLSPLSKMTAYPLALSDYKRYGRQMILDGFGLEGMYPPLLEGVLTPKWTSLIRKAQLKLKSAKVVVIGAGGLGCPVLQYLGAAGLGTSLPSKQERP